MNKSFYAGAVSAFFTTNFTWSLVYHSEVGQIASVVCGILLGIPMMFWLFDEWL